MNEKRQQSPEGYHPTVKVSTIKLPLLSEEGRGGRRYGEVEVRISDNGPGIPAGIRDKIFQPFFTTKPTGQGTGLGLSLAYESVKAQGGEIRVESEVGVGTAFIISF